jgi:hypothetical protein
MNQNKLLFNNIKKILRKDKLKVEFQINLLNPKIRWISRVIK